jgi:AcrR family transcriptional regulator
MTATAAETARQGRAEAQRTRILEAAKQCFIERGFHAASMANIAETADMSAGLMYRYFENKSAIVLAIIEEQLAKFRRDIAALGSVGDLGTAAIRHVEQWRARDPDIVSPALFLEMSAEGTRDPAIAEAIRASDRQTGEELVAWLRQRAWQGGAGLTEDEATVQGLLLRCLFEGLAVRTVREPDLDREVLARAVRAFFERVLVV